MERQLITKPGTQEAKTNDYRPSSLSHEPHFQTRGFLHSRKNLSNKHKLYPAKLQAKLDVSQPGDLYEQETEQVADRVMRMPTTSVSSMEFSKIPVFLDQVQRKCSNSCKQNPDFHSSGYPASRILQPQITAGNQEVQILLKSRALQAKLRIGQPNDIYEQEADRVAEQVMRLPSSKIIRRKCPNDKTCHIEYEEVKEKEFVQLKVDETTRGEISVSESMLDSLGPGHPLDKETRAFMEFRFGHDFSNVRVHTDDTAANIAQALNARAFTVGRNIMFGGGQYAPRTTTGSQLLAHELTHTLQQGEVTPLPAPVKTSRATDTAIVCDDHIITTDVMVNPSKIMRSSSTAIQRFTVDDDAGGCGICMGPQSAGNIAHKQVQKFFINETPLRYMEEQFKGCGKLDMFHTGTEPKKVGEIKPASEYWLKEGEKEVKEYIDCLHKKFGFQAETLTWIHLTGYIGIFEEKTRPSSCESQQLFVNPPKKGVYGYYCLPTYRYLKRTGLCGCTEREDKEKKKQNEQAESAAKSSAGADISTAGNEAVVNYLSQRAPWVPRGFLEWIVINPEGLYRFPGTWAGHYKADYVIWKDRIWAGPDKSFQHIEVYQEFPKELDFYRNLKFVKEESFLTREQTARQLYEVFIQYNTDIWSMLVDDKHRSPYQAREELSAINAEISRMIITAFASAMAAGIGGLGATSGVGRQLQPQVKTLRSVEGATSGAGKQLQPQVKTLRSVGGATEVMEKVIEEVAKLLKAA